MILKFFVILSLLFVQNIYANTILKIDEKTELIWSLKNSKTNIIIKKKGDIPKRVKVTEDFGTESSALPDKIKLIALVKETAIIIMYTYEAHGKEIESNESENETFLRIISIANKQPKEVYKVRTQSKFDKIELQEVNGILWNKKNSTLQINWHYAPVTHREDEIVIQIKKDGELKIFRVLG